ncbi:MAG: DNA gyrase inhibitor YacG [Cellvibrionaceae bacterium]
MSNKKATTVKCPTCHTEIEWSEKSPYRPFCSKRCKLIDFGDWAEERNSIPGSPSFDDILSGDLDQE